MKVLHFLQTLGVQGIDGCAEPGTVLNVKKKPSPATVTIDELLDAASERVDAVPLPARRGSAFLGLVAGAGALAVGLALFGAPAVVGAEVGTREAVDSWEALPTELPDAPLAQHTVLLDRDGNEYARFFAEDRVPVPLGEVNPTMAAALVSIEDDRFYDHGALDTRGLARAAVKTAMGERQGGSTLTQQLVENTLLAAAGDDEDAIAAARAQSLSGKVQELRYSVALEEEMSKDQILEEYLNTVYFGNGAYGVGAAARRYFNVPAADLTAGQSALLAGLMRSPTNYDPVTKPDAATDRRDTVLKRMLETSRIDQATYDAAVAEPITLQVTRTPSGCQASAYSLYCAYVRDQLLSDPAFGATSEEREESLYRGGLTVTTALVRSVSDKASAAAAAPFEPSNRVADGVAVVEPGTGYVSALAQSKPYGQGPDETEIVYATRAAFQPGSTFKAITLANALEQGFDPRERITSNSGYRSRVSDNPASGAFRNSGNANPGAIDAYEASKKSVNTFYVQLIERYGVQKTADMAARLGITSLPRTGDGAITDRSASLTLGAYETSPLQMASAYAAFAANGVACRATGIVSAVRTTTNTPVDVPPTDCHQAVSVEVAKSVTDILQGGFTEGGTAAGRGINRPEFGKTGTTNSNAATWFVGSTPQYTTAVWVGDPRGGTRYPLTRVRAYGSFMGTLFGATVAARVWQDAMGPIHDGLPVLALGTPSVGQGVLRTRTIPEVRGMTTEQAVTALLAAGYQVTVNPVPAALDPLLSPDHVLRQDPASGVDVTSGALVTLELTNGSRTDVELPDVPVAGSGATGRNP